MNAYATQLSEGFASQVLKKYFAMSLTDKITNSDYEGEIKGVKSKLHIPTIGDVAWKNYTGNMGTPDGLEESDGLLNTDQKKRYYFKVESYKEFLSYIKNPESQPLTNAAAGLKRLTDKFVLGLYGDVAAGNRVGTDYTDGTVAIDGDGNVTGTNTVFTAAMVGKGFKAAGHDKWYRIKSRASNTSIVIENDEDDVTSHYDGGVIGAGATHTVQAVTPVTISKTTIYHNVNLLAQYLDDVETPEEGRWLVVPNAVKGLIRECPEFVPAVESARNEVVKRGLVGDLLGFTVYSASPLRMDGNATDGWHIMGGHTSAITFALGFTESGIEDLTGDFGKAYKGLSVYGAKVPDVRRSNLVELYAKL